MIFSTKKSGFTLVEMLVYIGIFLVITTAAVGFLISLNSFIKEYQVETALYRSATSVLEQTQLSLRQGNGLDTANSATSTSEGILVVTKGATTTELAKVGDDLEFSINNVLVGDLLADEVVVTDFTVFHYPLAIGEMVRVRLGLSATVGSTTKSNTFYTGAVIRNSI